MSTDNDTATWHRVRLHGDGRTFAHDEEVRGHDMDEAIANAEHQWPRSRVEYLGEDAQLPVHDPDRQDGSAELADNLGPSDGWMTQLLADLNADPSEELHDHRAHLPTRDEVFGDGYDPDVPRDWWGEDYPDEHRDTDGAGT